MGLIGPYFRRPTVILRTSDGGETWTSQLRGMSALLLGVSFVDVNNAIAVGELDYGNIFAVAAIQRAGQATLPS